MKIQIKGILFNLFKIVFEINNEYECLEEKARQASNNKSEAIRWPRIYGEGAEVAKEGGKQNKSSVSL